MTGGLIKAAGDANEDKVLKLLDRKKEAIDTQSEVGSPFPFFS